MLRESGEIEEVAPHDNFARVVELEDASDRDVGTLAVLQLEGVEALIEHRVADMGTAQDFRGVAARKQRGRRRRRIYDWDGFADGAALDRASGA